MDFNALVAAFDEECKKTGYIKNDLAAAVSRKRPSQSTANRESSSKGGGYKRPRRW